MIQNIIFDFDGVLVDSEIIAGRSFSRYLAKRNITFTEQEFARNYTGNKTVNVISDLSNKFNIEDKETFFNEVMLIANNIYSIELTATAGIKDLLVSIQQNKLIGSNSPKKRIIQGLEKVDLNKYFNKNNIFSFDMVENPKPSPDIYLKAVEAANIHPKDTIIIEDSIVGVHAGVAANIKVIGYTAGGHWVGRSYKSLIEAGAFTVATNCKELLNIITKL